jgi:cobalt-zinc-cadmium efflux system protein
MDHAHSHSSSAADRRSLRLALILTALTMLVEAAGGFISRSLALLADAGHMLTDVAALGFSLFAFWLADRPRSAGHTFGWRRFEIFAAFLNGVALWAISGLIAYEAYERFKAPLAVRSGLMLIVAFLGLVINAVVGAILYQRRTHSLNIRGSFIHVLADGLGSVGVLLAAILIRVTGSYLWDPAVSLVVCLLVLWSSTRLVFESFHILMEGAPRGLDIKAVRETLAGIPGVLEVHDLHVWTVTSGFVSLSAHLKVRPDREAKDVLREAKVALEKKFGVSHATLQLEYAQAPGCETACCEEENPACPKE